MLPWGIASLLLVVGCNDGPNLAPVTGTVTVNGAPLPQAGVTFTPMEGGRPAWATTDQQGQFQLTTLSNGDGALVGEHLVTVAEKETDAPIIPKGVDPEIGSLYAEMPTNRKPRNNKGTLDPRFASRGTSDLTFTVEANTANVAEFNLSN